MAVLVKTVVDSGEEKVEEVEGSIQDSTLGSAAMRVVTRIGKSLRRRMKRIPKATLIKSRFRTIPSGKGTHL